MRDLKVMYAMKDLHLYKIRGRQGEAVLSFGRELAQTEVEALKDLYGTVYQSNESVDSFTIKAIFYGNVGIYLNSDKTIEDCLEYLKLYTDYCLSQSESNEGIEMWTRI